ncbi:helix-turn-helix domain-containing protein [Streptomyces sp. NPDC059506]|uniref:helix-turn-helix domain-containing protein n=1 Tax=Streptomyces sp. NPDC059506 TaxID=3347751 RepID=UPI003686C109
MEEHSAALRHEVLAMLQNGASQRAVSDQFGVPRGTIGWWAYEDRRRRGIVIARPCHCPRCKGVDFDHSAYSYLLGLYLGDGHIVSKPKQHHLSIYCCDNWPGLIDEAEKAMRTVMPGYSTSRIQKKGCTEVKSYTSHWTCMFPQHGPGRKHERAIALEDWQEEIVEEHPWGLIRGLIHSDGCRVTNWTVRTVGGERKRYEYPRYFFTNKSDDIRQLLGQTLDKVGVEWTTLARGSDPFNISVARRESVALMDLHVGAKY